MKMNIMKYALCPKCGLLECEERPIHECESSDIIWRDIKTCVNDIGFTNHQLDNNKKIIWDHKKDCFIINQILSAT